MKRGPLDELRHWLEHADAQAKNAARRNKPAMWSYWLMVRDGLRGWFAEIDNDGGVAGAALALMQRAELQCPTLPHREAAELWALRVYAVRILRAWGAGVGGRRSSLAWLRARAGVTRPVASEAAS